MQVGSKQFYHDQKGKDIHSCSCAMLVSICSVPWGCVPQGQGLAPLISHTLGASGLLGKCFPTSPFPGNLRKRTRSIPKRWGASGHPPYESMVWLVCHWSLMRVTDSDSDIPIDGLDGFTQWMHGEDQSMELSPRCSFNAFNFLFTNFIFSVHNF